VSALRDPRFRRLLVGQSLSSFGDSALYLSLAIWAKDLTGSNAAAGAVFFALGLPILFAPLAGHLVDRVSRRRLLIVTNAAAGIGVLALLAVQSRAQLWRGPGRAGCGHLRRRRGRAGQHPAPGIPA
jgi:MFS family permease